MAYNDVNLSMFHKQFLEIRFLSPGHTAHDNDTITITKKSFPYLIHVSGHTATYRTNVTANMNLI